ncbi:MAG: hypothetical protein AAGI54_06755 [Planctomycetota bacterium]
MNGTTTLETPRSVLVDANSGKKPLTVDRLRDWEYLERCLHRLICAWGRFFPDWNDKVTVHRHVWEQAEAVQRLRDRLVEFPGRESNLDQPVSPRLEAFANTVLDAPTHDDAVDGIYQVFCNALVDSYTAYCTSAHPVHDAPTLSVLMEVAHAKENMRLWLRDYRRRHPHTIDNGYLATIQNAIQQCDGLSSAIALEKGQTPAAPAGVNSPFRLPLYPARPAGTHPKPDFKVHIEANFETDLEARRLFWCVGYAYEMNLAMDQLRWLYDGHFMPWAFTRDISRHLWDESRHGDSGYSRLLDFGIGLDEIGFPSYDGDETYADRTPLRPASTASDERSIPAAIAADPITPNGLYERVFAIGMIAETGHFQVKREAYDDFKAAGDLESAEMMLFDIIDEQTHVQYAHCWLPVLAEHANVDNTDYRQRAANERESRRAAAEQRQAETKRLSRDESSNTYRLYDRLLTRMRDQKPLDLEAIDPSPRSALPM